MVNSEAPIISPVQRYCFVFLCDTFAHLAYLAVDLFSHQNAQPRMKMVSSEVPLSTPLQRYRLFFFALPLRTWRT